ncbi:GNAT family N-acetyltransferase [Rhodobacteraceae bacterium M382]|nr:GNAT family N-acetyltransferase [Rhodobacteraceae bacterium M382]
MTDNFDIRVMGIRDVARAVDWAAAEGWNPGHQDAACFAWVDRAGFWGGWIGDEMVAAISVVNYDDGFAFLGFYMVAPQWRGRGLGLRLWQAALDHAGGRVVGLDGVVDQQDNYARSGFDLAWRNIRYGGVPRALNAGAEELTLEIVAAPDAALEALDRSVFPANRQGFWRDWLGAPGHLSIRARRGPETVAFGTLRPCRNGSKIGPLVATSHDAAQTVLARLLQDLPAGQEVFLDVPEPNAQAVALAHSLGLAPVFETARMYRGAAPDLDVTRIFGVTSFELG